MFATLLIYLTCVMPCSEKERGQENHALIRNSDLSAASAAVVKLYGAAAGREHGYGTGVLVSSDGQVLTTLSILVAGRSVRAITADGARYDARVLRTDDARQLALLTLDAKDLPFLPVASSSELQPGDTIYAMGNCFKIAEGDEPVSISRGVFSLRLPALRAKRLAQEFEYGGPALVYDAITANPGAAGGPVLDDHGRFVGLVGKVVEAAATNTRLNYAIPAEVLSDFLGDRPVSTPSTRPAAKQARPFVGIKLSELGYQHVSAFVERVRPGSPAAAAGIKPDDLIVGVDTESITDADSYRKAIASLVPGQAVRFTIKRAQKVLTLQVTVGEEP